jgi:hypothetical protein
MVPVVTGGNKNCTNHAFQSWWRLQKSEALMAQILRTPRSLLTTKVASASPSMTSAMIRNGRPDFGNLIEEQEETIHDV